MGIFSRIFGIFRRKKETTNYPNLDLQIKRFDISPQLASYQQATTETASLENLKAKMDLILTQIENLKIQYDTLNEKIDRIERTLGSR